MIEAGKIGKPLAVSFLFPSSILRLPAFYIIWHNNIGINTAGSRFMILSLVKPSIFKPRPIMSTEPAQVISAMVYSRRNYNG